MKKVILYIALFFYLFYMALFLFLIFEKWLNIDKSVVQINKNISKFLFYSIFIIPPLITIWLVKIENLKVYKLLGLSLLIFWILFLITLGFYFK